MKWMGIFFIFLLACSKGQPKVTGLVSSQGMNPISLKSSLATNVQSENLISIGGTCDPYPGRLEIRRAGGDWVAIDSVASGDVDCRDGNFQVSLSPEKLGITSRGRIELQVRQVFRFGYSSVQSFSIWVLDESPSLSLKYSTWYVNLAANGEYIEVKGACNLEDGNIALSAARLGETLSLGVAVCKDKIFSKSISTDLFTSSATWSLNATYQDASSYFATATLISDTWPLSGLSHGVIQNSVSAVEGNQLSGLKFVASYPDPSIQIVYSFDLSRSTCFALNWESPLLLAEDGSISGRPGLSTGGQTCVLYYLAKARNEEVSGLYYTLSFLESYCDRGSWDSTCEISSSKTIPNEFVFSGENFSISSEILTARDRTTNAFGKFSISANQNILVSGSAVIRSSLDLKAKSIQLESGSILDASGYGYFGWHSSDVTANVVRHGPCSGALASGGGYGGLGGAVSIASGVIANSYDLELFSPCTLGPGILMGSGGSQVASSLGGDGGGFVTIDAQTVDISGSILVNGKSGIGNGGGGAGGSISINAVDFSLATSGSLFAKGGDSGITSSGTGGGGKIDLQVTKNYTTLGDINLESGSTSRVFTTNFGHRGECGKLHTTISNVCDQGSLAGGCVITSKKLLGDGYFLNGSGSLELQSMGQLKTVCPKDQIRISFTEDIVIHSFAEIKANLNSMGASNIKIEANGLISASGLGYPGGEGPEVGFFGGEAGAQSYATAGVQAVGAGGGLFAMGGDISTHVALGSGLPILDCTSFCLGGGGAGGAILAVSPQVSTYHKGGNGGGYIKLVASGVLHNLGSIEANGDVGAGFAGGGGGGYIHLTVPLPGYINMGQVKAIGGDTSKIAASSSVYSGAGSGGKIKFNPTLSSPNPPSHSVSGGQAGIAGTPNGSSGGVIN